MQDMNGQKAILTKDKFGEIVVVLPFHLGVLFERSGGNLNSDTSLYGYIPHIYDHTP